MLRMLGEGERFGGDEQGAENQVSGRVPGAKSRRERETETETERDRESERACFGC